MGAEDGLEARRDVADWPVPVGQVLTHQGLTLVYSSEPGGFSVEEFRRIPDDRVELFDGMAFLRPGLTTEDREVLAGIYEALCATCPEHLVPVDSVLDMQVGPATVFRPDIQVLCGRGVDSPRALVVEVRPDFGRYFQWLGRDAKLHGYRDAGIPSYWALDPGSGSVSVYELKYAKRGSYSSEDVCARGQNNGWRLWSDPAWPFGGIFGEGRPGHPVEMCSGAPACGGA